MGNSSMLGFAALIFTVFAMTVNGQQQLQRQGSTSGQNQRQGSRQYSAGETVVVVDPDQRGSIRVGVPCRVGEQVQARQALQPATPSRVEDQLEEVHQLMSQMNLAMQQMVQDANARRRQRTTRNGLQARIARATRFLQRRPQE